MAKFLQDTLEEMSLKSEGESHSEKAKEFAEFFNKVSHSYFQILDHLCSIHLRFKSFDHRFVNPVNKLVMKILYDSRSSSKTKSLSTHSIALN